MSPSFDSAWLKWGRAVVHAVAYEADVERTRVNPNIHRFMIRVVAEYDPKRHGFVLTIGDLVAPPALWSVLLGDAVHDYRCALDHIAWTMYERGNKFGTLTEDDQRSIQFPIAWTTKWFADNIDKKIPGITRADRAKVRRRQPCRYAPRNAQLHCLTVLMKFSNADKHRAIQPLMSMPTGAELQVVNSRDCEIPTSIRTFPAKPLEVGTEMGVMHARKTGANPHAEVDIRVAAQPAISPRLTVLSWLDHTRAFVAGLLSELANVPRDTLIDMGVPGPLIP